MNLGAPFLLLLLSGCTARVVPPAPSCRDAGCAGCCDADQRCLAGDEDTACGLGASACAQCSAADRCIAQACAPRATGCAGCRDDAGTCLGGRATAACGLDGRACAACPTGQLCSAGACITLTQCDPSCGAQCCAGSTCAQSPCGTDGGACATCGSGELCGAGTCQGNAGTRWKLRVVSAHVAALRPGGEPWDDKNDPDPKVCATVPDAGQSCTLEVSDTFDPAWNTTFSTAVDAQQLSQVELTVIDVDFPGQTVIEELGVLDLRPRWSGSPQQWTLDGASVSRLRVDVVPAP